MFDDQGRKRAWSERVYTEERVVGEFMRVFVIIKKVYFDAHTQAHTHTKKKRKWKKIIKNQTWHSTLIIAKKITELYSRGCHKTFHV